MLPASQDPAPAPKGPGLRPVTSTLSKPKSFHLVAFAVVLITGIVTFVVGFIVHQIAYHRFETSSDLAIAAAIGIGVGIEVLGGFVAARVARKIGLLEHFLGAIALWGITAAGIAIISVARLAVALPVALGPALGAAAAAVFGVLVFGFLGSSIGFLFGGQGNIDTSFSFEWYIARRHLMAKKRTTFVSVITILSVLGVAFGVWCLTVVLSVMSGFEDDLKQKILGTNAHAVVLKYATPFREYDEVLEETRGVRGVVGASPFILGQVMVSSRDQVDGVLLKGIVPATVGEVTDLPDNVQEGRGALEFLAHPDRIDAYLEGNPGAGNPLPPERADDEDDDDDADDAEPVRVTPGIAIGKELSRSLRVFVGDKINVISPISEDMGPTGPIPRSRAFRIAAIFYTGMYEYDSKFAYIDLAEAQDFFDMPGAVTGLEVRTTDIDDTRAITHRILGKIEGYPYYTKDWGEMNRNLFSALKLEKLVMAVILAFIVLIASFVILATLIMMVMEKGKEIAILKSMGVRDASIMKIFVLQGLVVGFLGTALGLGLGLASCAFIASGIIGLDPEVYYISHLPVIIEPVQIVLVCVISIVLSYLATIYPSITASRLHPVEGLRDE